MSLFIRISETDLSFARFKRNPKIDFSFESYHVHPQASLTANLHEAMKQVELLQDIPDKVEVYVNGPVTPIPLVEFQEEDVSSIYNYCFTAGENRRIFYDSVPAVNAVLLFALSESTCRTLEDHFGQVRYQSCLTPVVQHFATKGLGNTDGRRMFVYTHDGTINLIVLEDSHLVMLNTYDVRTLTDVAYYTFNVASHLGMDLLTTPIFVVGFPNLRDPIVEELQKYAARVYPIHPSSEYNRNIVATTENVSYDLICGLLNT